MSLLPGRGGGVLGRAGTPLGLTGARILASELQCKGILRGSGGLPRGEVDAGCRQESVRCEVCVRGTDGATATEASAEQGQIGKQRQGHRRGIMSKTGRPLGGSCHQEQSEHPHILGPGPCHLCFPLPDSSLATHCTNVTQGLSHTVLVPGCREWGRARTEARRSLVKHCALNSACSLNLSFLSVQGAYNSPCPKKLCETLGTVPATR